ncbi:phosphoribosylanthranilate isomerase [Tepidibacillus sp. LV47]|uniref:phosphoribosylanthranilate isomerase n=1 Tax=Tepidibacillus sp. LV47 TaxID=3398228 RepID=UPI003AAE3BBA
MKVKICGIFEEQTLIDLKEKEIWPDYIGFVFAKSRRQVKSSQMKPWLKHIPSTVKTVGVFVNQAIEDVINAPVHILQFHGDEKPEDCQMIKERTGKEIWKVISVDQNHPFSIEHYRNVYERYLPVVDGFVFDTASKSRGGSGIKFEWEPFYHLWKEIEKPILVAGGITKEDIPMLKRFPIEGIDLSSGVEEEGKKSIPKIVELIEEVKRDDAVASMGD